MRIFAMNAIRLWGLLIKNVAIVTGIFVPIVGLAVAVIERLDGIVNLAIIKTQGHRAIGGIYKYH
jgi:hypothetical protein